MNILAIESSCDETAVAILNDQKQLLANQVFSQMAKHADFGGVIPEVASRIHVEEISLVLKEALKEADLNIQDIDAIAITCGPGLIGSLHVGLQAAKSLAWMYNLPLIGVHHIAGHIYANEYVTPLQYPLLACVVSGGHTELVLMREENQFEIIAQTADDAIGEAYDKVSKVMGLGYPGGPIIDRLAQTGQPLYPLPKVHMKTTNEFSYSGLKSAVIQLMAREAKANREINTADLACSFQERALQQLIDKTQEVLDHVSVKQVLLAGGVAANSRLRELMKSLVSQYESVECVIPPMKYCTDNAAMIAMAGLINYRHGKIHDLNLPAKSSLDLESF